MFAKTKEDLGILKCIDNEQNREKKISQMFDNIPDSVVQLSELLSCFPDFDPQ
jgi:hypothetical protein